MLKESLGYKKYQWGLFNEKVEKVVKQQQQDMTKAIIGHGQYQIRPQYLFLAVSEDKWFQMSEEQRLNWIKKFNACQVQECTNRSSVIADESSAPSGSTKGSSPDALDISASQVESSLSVTLQDMVSSTRLPYASVEGIWRKAKKLVTEINSVVCAPGFGSKDRMVKSNSGSSPHLVLAVTSASVVQYKCDDKCPHYKSTNICSHTIAAAESNGDLQQFMQWYCHHGKKVPNITQLSTHGMPAGAGEKGGKVARKKTGKKSIPADENRIPLSTAYLSSGQTSTTTTTTTTSYTSNMNTIHPNISSPSAIFNAFNNYSNNTWPTQSTSVNPSPYYMWSAYSPWSWSSPSLMGLPPAPMGPPPAPVGLPPAFMELPASPMGPPSPMGLPIPMGSPAAPMGLPPLPIGFPVSSSSELESSENDVFIVCLNTGNISVCNGCRIKFDTNDTIVIQHREFCKFTNPRNGLPSSKLGNAYYHLRRSCLEKKFGLSMSCVNIVIPDSMKAKHTSVHNDTLSKDFMKRL